MNKQIKLVIVYCDRLLFDDRSRSTIANFVRIFSHVQNDHNQNLIDCQYLLKWYTATTQPDTSH